MPTKRIPWFKVWVGATRHEKVAQLDDRAFRTWVELLDGASQQTVRGKFASVDAAAAVVRRPPSSIKRLISVGLLDERADGVWMHDWQDWQRWRPEDDVNNDPSPPDHPPNGYRSTHDQHTINNGTTQEILSRAAERAKTEKGEVDGEEDVTPAPSERPHQPVAKSRISVIDEHFTDELEDQFWEQFGSREAVQDSIAAALGYKKRSNYTDQRAFLRNWVRGDAERAQNRRGNRVVPIGRTAPRLGVRHA